MSGWIEPKPRGDGKTILTNMTMSELAARAKAPCSSRIFAAGMYQIIPETRMGLLKKLPHLRHSKFTPAVQKEMALELIKKRPYASKWIAGDKNVSIDHVVHDLSQEWASIAVPKGFLRKNGTISNGAQSYYGSGNKSNATSNKMVVNALLRIRQYYVNNQ